MGQTVQRAIAKIKNRQNGTGNHPVILLWEKEERIGCVWEWQQLQGTQFFRKRSASKMKMHLKSCRELTKAFLSCCYCWDRLMLPSNTDNSWKHPNYSLFSNLADNYNVGFVLQNVGLLLWFITCWAFQGIGKSPTQSTEYFDFFNPKYIE